MKRILLTLLILYIAQLDSSVFANEPDSAWLFAYTTEEQRSNGLEFAWSTDGENWHFIGPGHRYVRSDYGTEKKMLQPILTRDEEGIWHCLWRASDKKGVFAHVASDDLVKWQRQSYEIDEEIYTKLLTNRQNITDIKGNTLIGTKHIVEWSVIDGLIKVQQLSAYKGILYAETMRQDSTRFVSLQPIEVKVNITAMAAKPIGNQLIGIFFEDINYAADGGIYAELIQNRSFEYSPGDKLHKDTNWNSQTAWELKGENVSWNIDTLAPIHSNNRHYAKLELSNHDAVLVNEGFSGIVLKAGDKYDFSLFSRIRTGKGGWILVRLVDEKGEICAEGALKANSSDWKKQQLVLTAKRNIIDAKLEIHPQFTGVIDVDMISLFPQKTFKGRKNGMRVDLAQIIADIEPKFVRFPGGCVAHGFGLENMYRWKNTIGPLETRKSQRNIWNYHQTAGLGYFEYFQFCEDIEAEPLPVVPAGVPCQNSEGGQQGGIPMCDMNDYIQEILDLIEWANGGSNTKWGKIRAEAGHPKPFNLKYIGIGNEDMISDIFEERFTLIYNAVKERYPKITIIGTTGPFFEGTDYEEGWKLATKLGLSIIDEHYYRPPGWYIHNQDYYDRYDRGKSKVYLGEYAAHAHGGPNLESALAEALHLANIERNGDIVSMTSYAPLLAKQGNTQWNPNLIYFNNTEIYPTPGYYVQKLYGQNAGDEYLPSKIILEKQNEDVRKRFTISTVCDSKTGDLIIKIINLLPVSVKPALIIEGYTLNNVSISKHTLKGQPQDKNIQPVENNCNVEEMSKGKIEPYSFTVYRVKQNILK